MLGRLEEISTLECHRTMDELLLALRAGGGERNSDVVIVTCSEDDDIVGRVRGALPASRVLELVNGVDPEHLALAASTHADGYLMVQDITDATLDSTLRALMSGEVPMPVPIASHLLGRARGEEFSPLRCQPYFSPREHDVIALLLEGCSNRQIADKMGVSLHSAKRHVSSVLSKVNSPSRAHFVAHALRNDWLPAQRL
ncbi:LuxR C-terminal-related transcriptional regulator [Streptomyces sp. NPDC045251]|uniref:helix-turn-helix transcriptional regulator n=1 Tax=unclassified Streptomyces TaxID=2593676 RepID=UPI00340B2B35